MSSRRPSLRARRRPDQTQRRTVSALRPVAAATCRTSTRSDESLPDMVHILLHRSDQGVVSHKRDRSCSTFVAVPHQLFQSQRELGKVRSSSVELSARPYWGLLELCPSRPLNGSERTPTYATFCSMHRARVSTTVDARSLGRARQLLPGPDSRMFDRALAALIQKVEEELELAALSAHPYEDDPDLAWEAPPGPDLPYDGEVPREVAELARRRRRQRR